MDPNKRLPTELDSLHNQHEIDTAKAEADNTLIDIDQVVREAVRDSEPCQLDARAGALISRLADLQTIRRLAEANVVRS